MQSFCEEKRRKKSCLLFLMFSLIFFFSACSSNNNYIIAVDNDFAPFCFVENNEVKGIDIDLMKEIAEDQNIKVEFKTYSFSAAVSAIQTSQADGIIAGMSITEERKKSYDFSNPYYVSRLAVISRGDDQITKGIESARGKKVAIKVSSEGSRYAEMIKNEYNFETNFFDDSSTMYEQVKSGNAVICFEDEPVAKYNIKQGSNLKIVNIIDKSSPYGFAVLKGKNGDLLEKFNKGLDNIKQNGKYKTILDKYIDY